MLTSLDGMKFISVLASIPVLHMVQINCPSNLKELERVGPADASLLFVGELFPLCSEKEEGG